MNTEKLIAKGVEKHFDGQIVLFKVESLNEHFKGLVIHESDWVSVEDEAYVVLSDVNFDNATDNEIQRDLEVEETPYEESEEGTVGIVSTLTPEEADDLIKEFNLDIVADTQVGEFTPLVQVEDYPIWVNPSLDEIEVVDEVVIEPTPKKSKKK